MAGRRRGVTLIEGILYLSLAGSLLVFTGQILFEDSQRRQEVVAGADYKLVLEAAQRYVADTYDARRVELFDGTTAGTDPLIAAFDLTGMRDAGYIPAAYLNATGNTTAETPFDQTYSLFLRAVDRNDTSVPQATLTRQQVEAAGAIDPVWVNGVAADGEMDIEAILVTTGGENVPANRGNRITALTGTTSAGHIRVAGQADGAFGAWTLNITPFQALTGYPDAGRFAGLVALSRFGAIAAPGVAADTRPFLSRCADTTPATAAFDTCMTALAQDAGRVFSDVVFNSYDSDGDGSIDTVPMLRLGQIEMGFDADGDGVIDATVLDTDNDGTANISTEIVGLTEIACAASTTPIVAAGTLLIDCAAITLDGDTSVDGTLGVTGATTLGGATTVNDTLGVTGATTLDGATTVNNTLGVTGATTLANSVTFGGAGGTVVTGANGFGAGAGAVSGLDIDGVLQAGRLLLDDNNDGTADADLSETIRTAGLYAHGDTVPIPTCPAISLGGAAMQPRVYVVPAAWSDPNGVPVVGVRASASVNGAGTGWTVEYTRFIAQNDGSGNAVSASIASTEGRVLVLTRCF